MANALLSFTNHVDGSATVMTASSEVSGLPPSNLARPQIATPWRAEVSSPSVQADFGEAKTVGVVALAIPRNGVMPSASDTIRLQLDATTAGAGVLLDTGAVACGIDANFGYWLYALSSPVSARYLVLTFATTLAYFQAGRLWAGPVLQPGRNFAYDWSRQWNDGGQVGRAPKSGVRYADAGPRFRSVAVAFNALTEAEAKSAEDGDILQGVTGQILLCTNPSSPARTTLFGAPRQVDPIAQPAFPIFAKPYALDEDL